MAQNKKRTKSIEVFCDGGFGNRYNSLVAGMAVARHFDLPLTVYWPVNHSCEARFGDIFVDGPQISEKTIKMLSGTLANAFCLLHDTIGSETLKVDFHSAYQYESLKDFGDSVLGSNERVFFYPALIPVWIPGELIQQAVRALTFQPALSMAAAGFIQEELGAPFYGIHLRRTDLNVGLCDTEVQDLVRRYPGEKFFVCSDDPVAEAMAAAQPNVRRRQKNNHIGKMHEAGDWNAPVTDDAGRSYFSNIRRGAAAVLEGVVDLLILGHSQIVGASGSTFQSVARMIGQHAPLVNFTPPAPIAYTALRDLLRIIKSRHLPLSEICNHAEALVKAGRSTDAIEVLLAALEISSGLNRFVLLYNLGVYLANLQRHNQATIYIKSALEICPGHEQATNLFFRVAQAAMTQ
jgi:tetratricopeptide (TPR) repeat protein